METIKLKKAKKLIETSNGRIFSATYIKKDFSERLILARLKTKYKSKTGRKAPYNAKEYNLLHVFDMQKKGYRTLNYNTLLKLSINKNKYKI